MHCNVPGEHSVTGLYVNEPIAMRVLAFEHEKAGHVAVLMMSKRDSDWIVGCDCGVLSIA